MVIEPVCQRLIELPQVWKRVLLVTADTLTMGGALIAAMWMVPGDFRASLAAGWLHLPLAGFLAVSLFAFAGFYRSMIRFTGDKMLFRALVVILITMGAMALARSWAPVAGLQLPAPTLLLFTAFSMLALVGGRLLMRELLLMSTSRRGRVIVYGAGDAGIRLIAALASSGRFRPMAAIDDDPRLQGRLLNGVRIWPASELPRLIKDLNVRRVLLAIPSVSRARRRRIIEQLVDFGVRVQTVPDVSDIITGRARVDDLREVDALDVLGRDPVPPNRKLLLGCIENKSVLVTGAGGSIGSELCRQIVSLGPRRLVLLELSEIALYRIERELQGLIRAQDLDVEILPLLGSIHNRRRVRKIMHDFGVQTVYHSAAYKHVPIVEQNMLEGVYNNIIGTWYLAEAAASAGAETFVLISTDKAVSPVNVMGATKRMAELVLQGMAARGGRTRFCMVRFGNVLDSSGSVVPLFREQIRRGGPVTVTHREVIRYFMTITEASQLVLQASSMCKGGDVFLLDMGEPVRIFDLARRMIQLMGLSARDEKNPTGDISIEFTGLRPGDKLYEELLIGGRVSETEHPMIRRAIEESLDWESVHSYLQQLLIAIAELDCARASEILHQAVAGYASMTGRIEDLVWNECQPTSDQMPASDNLYICPAAGPITVESPLVTELPAQKLQA